MNTLHGMEDDILREEMEEYDPFGDDDEDITKFYSTLKSLLNECIFKWLIFQVIVHFNEQECGDIFGENDVDESDFIGF